MKNLPPLPETYFEKFSTNPVIIKPFNPKSKIIAQDYIRNLRKTLDDVDVEILHRGSTAFGISGKGDIEIGVYPTNENWDKVLSILKQKYKEVGNLENDYARFNDEIDGFEIEVIVQKGRAAEIDHALTKFLLENPDLLKQYEEVKQKYSYSKREYQIHKNEFLSKVIDMILE